MKGIKASVFGATGLVGKQVVEQLIENDNYQKIILPNRRKVTYESAKVETQQIDFDHLEKHMDMFEVDHIFICLGTTINKAGSKEAFKKVDYHIPKSIAEYAAKKKVEAVVMISSLGADADSSTFYLKTKGEVEKAVKKLLGDRAFVVRPSMLFGKRQEFRLGEEVGKLLMKALFFIIPKKYRGIHDYEVAAAMIRIANEKPKQKIFISDELKRLSN